MLIVSPALQGQEASQILPNPHGLEMTLWAREPMLRNPVALSFDDRGRLFVVETARRGTVDIDIRAHKDWAYDDLANQSISQLRLFFWEKMNPERSSANASWLLDRNGDGSHDWRDLETISERVYRLEDTDGDGVADVSKVFYEGFNEEFNGVVAGVMPWEDSVWVTVYPDLWQFQDHDDDGIADERRSAFRGFGVHAAYDGHDIHGLTVGPEGKLYFSVGDNGISAVTLEGRRIHHPNTGGVLRMNPDGSELELFAYGLRNVQEIAFDQFGNLFSVDNDGDIEDERERFVHIVEGSDAGWRYNWQLRTKGWTRTMKQPFYNPWVHEPMWVPYYAGQPAHITPPISNYSVGPGGFKYNPGTALTPAYEDHFFLAQFPVQKITAFRAEPQGASFIMENEHVFHFGMMASAMNFGPDGAMYLADWDGKWQPNDRGAIWRLDDPERSQSGERKQVQSLLNEGFEKRSSEELVALLGHRDQRIRQRAQHELAARAAGNQFLAVIQDLNQAQLARIHALWGLIEMRGDGIADLAQRLPWTDSDPEIRRQAARVAGDLQLVDAGPDLIRLLASEQTPPVRLQAAIGLGKLRTRRAVPHLISLLRENDNQDAFLRHGAVMGLTGAADDLALERLSKDRSVAVRIGAVNALRRQGSPRVQAFLEDSNEWVQAEAARAIHDDFSIPTALRALGAHLESPHLQTENEAIVRRAISANLRLGNREHAQRLMRYALQTQAPEALRIEAIESLRVWNARPYLDRVTGRARHLLPRNPNIGNQLLATHALTILEGAAPALKATLTAAIRSNQLKVPDSVLWHWFRDTGESTGVRLDAFQLLIQKDRDTHAAPALQAALKDPSPALRLAAIRNTITVAPETGLRLLEDLDAYEIPEQQAILALAPQLPAIASGNVLNRWIKKLATNAVAPELVLDLMDAAEKHPDSSIRESIAEQRGQRDPYAPSVAGGDAARGKLVYETHIAAQCVRCHNAGGAGKQVGPVLEGIGERVDANYLLEALLEPSATIAPGFQNISLDLNDGETYDGILVAEDDELLTLGLVTGELKTVNKKTIHFRRTSQLSAMPSMRDLMSPFEIRDLIAYLREL